MSTTVTGTTDAPPAAEDPQPVEPHVPAWARVTDLLWRFRSALVCLGFGVLCLLQSPGRTLGDTKLDLVVDPIGFLGRALTLWEPLGSGGQVQNQAYGYFFPMGPFFALGDVVGLPPWIVQRLWFTLIMSVAFLGVVLLARRLRIGTPGTALVAAIAYALAPRIVSEIGSTSIELVPMALAPWVIVPLAGASRHGSARRAATLSALAVFCVGGVNAVATSAVLPLAVLFLLTRPAGSFRRRLIAWWVVAVGLASAWWLGPLVLLGRYSPPFLYYIENAQATTQPTDLLSVLRGTSHWIAGLADPSGPAWPAGWALIHEALPVAGTVVLATSGLVALCRRDLSERRWLVLGLLTGVGLVSLGHLAQFDGLWAQQLHDALDGPLAPLRNVHKFEPVVRLPLVLGAAHLGAVLVRRARTRPGVPEGGSRRVWRYTVRLGARAVLVALLVGLVATVSPALAGRLAPPGGFTEIPQSWQQTADYLADEQPSGRALLVPGSSFGTYEWGTTNDEVMQPLAQSPWDVRSSIPLTPEGHIRMLDAIEARLATGHGSAGLAEYLARAGISHLVLRNDLDSGKAKSTRSILVRQALQESPGITLAASFGTVDEPAPVRLGLLFDAGLNEATPAIQVYAVAGTAPEAWTAPLSSAVTVVGGPEALLSLTDRGLVTGRPTLMAGSSESGDTVMVTDALVRRERNFGRLADATSGALSVDEPLTSSAPVRDYLLPDMAAAESVVRYDGGTPTASSSQSDANGFQGTRMDAQPWSAVDGDPTTAWRPASWEATSEPPWWRLTTDRLFAASTVVVALGQESGVARPSELRLTTDGGSIVVPVADTGEEQTLPLPEGYSSSLTISSTVPGDDENAPALALAEVRLPGVAVQRSIVTPAPPAPAVVYAFDAQRGRSGCVVDANGTPRCAGSLVTGSEESVFLDRTFTVDGRTDYDIEATGVARPGAALDALLAQARGDIQVQGSSSAVADPRGSPAAALDGDPATAWVAAGDDEQPALALTLPDVRTIDSLRVVTTSGLAAAVATAITVDDGRSTQRVLLAADGTAQFSPMTTDRLTVTFEADDLQSLDPATRWKQQLGVGVSELEVGGPNPVVDPGTAVLLPCGSGPTVAIDARVMLTEVSTTVGALLDQEPVSLTFCDAWPVTTLSSGDHRLIGRSSATIDIDSGTLTKRRSVLDTSVGFRLPAGVDRWDAEHRTVDVVARDEPTLLVVPENTNPGWTARLDGDELEAVTVDGWQQGYVLPAGPAGTVELDFTPGDNYRAVLAGGAGAVLLLVVLAVLPARPVRAGSRRRHRLPTAVSAVVAALSMVGAVVLGAALIGGLLGVGAVAVLWAVGLCTGRWRAAVLGTVAGGTLLVAGTLLLVDRSGTGTAVQVLAIVALAAAGAGVLPEPGFGRSATGRTTPAR